MYMALEYLIPETEAIFKGEDDRDVIGLAQDGIKGAGCREDAKECD